MYLGYGITFDSAGCWSFDNDTARNVIIFGVDNSSSSHSDNPKNSFLILSKGASFGINGTFGSPEKRLGINCTKTNTKFCLSLHYNADNFYLFVNGKEIVNLKLTIKMLTFHHNFVSEVYLMDLVILSLQKYLQMEMRIIFQSTRILLVNLMH